MKRIISKATTIFRPLDLLVMWRKDRMLFVGPVTVYCGPVKNPQWIETFDGGCYRKLWKRIYRKSLVAPEYW